MKEHAPLSKVLARIDTGDINDTQQALQLLQVVTNGILLVVGQALKKLKFE